MERSGSKSRIPWIQENEENPFCPKTSGKAFFCEWPTESRNEKAFSFWQIRREAFFVQSFQKERKFGKKKS